jgi:hypothetical protein
LIDPEIIFDLLPIYRSYENDDIVHCFSGDYISYDTGSVYAGEYTVQLLLTDLIDNEAPDELITALTFGDRNFYSYEPMIKTGSDQRGQYESNEYWQPGEAEYILKIFRKFYYDRLYNLVNIEEFEEEFFLHD